MSTRKVWDHTIEIKEVFMPRKGKVYLVLAQGCGQTLGLGLGQSKDIVVVFY